MAAGCSGSGAERSGGAPKTAEVARGEEIFERVCSACHVISAENMVGPGLRGVIGRHVASKAGYAYSEAIKRDQSQTWTPERIQSYLMGPLNMYPEGRMAITPLGPEDAKSLVAYLQYRQAGE
ncbi:hypothetical protein IP83_01600 [Novosphingobium sp. AAP93]|nr:hypothetical protein IP83_01600 [Novosphingobium sp. AAP93]